MSSISNLSEVQRLVQDEADYELPLMIAARNHHLRMVEYLVEQGGADEDAATPRGHSALHYSSLFHDEIEVPQYLLDRGADIEKRDHLHGWTPLHYAVTLGRTKILSLLMSYGANIYVKDYDDRLPIDLAKTEEIKQAIRDEEVRREHRFKRIPVAAIAPVAVAIQVAAASDTKDGGEDEEEEGDDDECSGNEDDDED